MQAQLPQTISPQRELIPEDKLGIWICNMYCICVIIYVYTVYIYICISINVYTVHLDTHTHYIYTHTVYIYYTYANNCDLMCFSERFIAKLVKIMINYYCVDKVDI